MINLRVFPKNHFDTKEISDDNIDLFTQDHIERLKANNPDGKWDAIIAATEAAHQIYFTAKSEERHSTAVKEGATVTVENLATQFKALVSQKEGIIRGTWGKDSAIYQEFYPQGVTQYTNATYGNIKDLMDSYVQACTDHEAELPANFKETFTKLRDDFALARSAQLNKMGDVSGDKLATAEKRDVLEIQLMKNVLAIAADNVGNPDIIEVYFRQHYIRSSAQPGGGEGGGEELTSGIVGPQAKVTVQHGNFDANTEFRFINTGETVLQFYTANLPDDPVPGAVLELQPGEEAAAYASELGSEENLFLMVFNPDEEDEGSYEAGVVVSE